MGEFTVRGSTDSANLTDLTDEARPPIRRPAQRSGTSLCRAAQSSVRACQPWAVLLPGQRRLGPSLATQLRALGPGGWSGFVSRRKYCLQEWSPALTWGPDGAPQNGDFHVLSRPRSTVLRAVPGSNCVGTIGCLTVLGRGRGWAWRYLGVEKRRDWKGRCRNGHYTGRGGGCDSNSPTVGHLSPSCPPIRGCLGS